MEAGNPVWKKKTTPACSSSTSVLVTYVVGKYLSNDDSNYMEKKSIKTASMFRGGGRPNSRDFPVFFSFSSSFSFFGVVSRDMLTARPTHQSYHQTSTFKTSGRITGDNRQRLSDKNLKMTIVHTSWLEEEMTREVRAQRSPMI